MHTKTNPSFNHTTISSSRLISFAMVLALVSCAAPLPELGPVPGDKRIPGRYYYENFPASFEIASEWKHHPASWWNKAHFDKSIEDDGIKQNIKFYTSARIANEESDLYREFDRFSLNSEAMLDVSPDLLVAEKRGKRNVGRYKGLFVSFSEERGDDVVAGEFVAFWAEGVVYRFSLECAPEFIEALRPEFELILASFLLYEKGHR